MAEPNDKSSKGNNVVPSPGNGPGSPSPVAQNTSGNRGSRGRNKNRASPSGNQNNNRTPGSNPSNSKDFTGKKITEVPAFAQESVPPINQQVRSVQVFQSIAYQTVYFLGLLISYLTAKRNMAFSDTPTLSFNVFLDGAFFTAFIFMTLAAKCARIVEAALYERYPHKLGRGSSIIVKKTANYLTIKRALDIAAFIGIYKTDNFETTLASMSLYYGSFYLSCGIMWIVHLSRNKNRAASWCAHYTWLDLFPNFYAEKSRPVNPDAGGSELDSWFDCFFTNPDEPSQLLVPPRDYLDQQDLRMEILNGFAAVLVNSFRASVLVRGETVGSGYRRFIAIDTMPLDLYYLTDTATVLRNSEINVVKKIDLEIEDDDIGAEPVMDNFTQQDHQAGGRYTQQVLVGHCLTVCDDVNDGTLDPSGTVYYQAKGPRFGQGIDVERCEALMLCLQYLGVAMWNEQAMGKFGRFDSYFYGDKLYYQDDSAQERMVESNQYQDFFVEINRFSSMLVAQLQKNIADFYDSQLKLYKIRLYKLPKFNINGAVSQALSYFSTVSSIFGRPYDSFRSYSDSTPSVASSAAQAQKVAKPDVGILIAPCISTHRDAVTKVIPHEGRTDIADRYIRKPWDDFGPFTVFGDRFN